MDEYCLLGNPVEHSKSPWIHARFAELTGQSLRYQKRLVPLDGFAAVVRAFRAEGGLGCNITVPFKFEASDLATERTERAELAQASNFLHFKADGIYADNTDGAGLVNDIERNAGVALRGRDVLLLGAGGASAGVLGPLIRAGARRIAVANRSIDKAQALIARHAALALACGAELQACGLQDVPAAFDVIINGTTTSLQGGAVPVGAQVLKPGSLAIDMMYGPATEGFMQWAQDHGAVARDGLGMLVEQAAEAFALWRGIHPPAAQVLAELRTTLA